METEDSQFGYKKGHSTSHAIELVRVLEQNPDCHVCMLDASAAFDSLSWPRIMDQLQERYVPVYLIKLCMVQLISTRISICGTEFFYARAGVKQGGVLSGRFFSICYDTLVKMLRKTGAGTLLKAFKGQRAKLILLQIIIYADDILLLSRSPSGLSHLINLTLKFSHMYADIKFNPSKSCILRLGTKRKPPVSVHGIPTANSIEYLGVMIGRAADPSKFSASSLYSKTNLMLQQNKELHRCSRDIKNLAIASCLYVRDIF